MAALSKLARIALAIPVFLVVWIVVSVPFMFLLGPLMGHERELPVSAGKVPGLFPVFVVVTPGEAEEKYGRVVYYSMLAEYTQENATYTYLIPDDLASHHSAMIKVQRLSKGRQSVEVTMRQQHGRIVGWYEATDKEIYPRRCVEFWNMDGGVGLFPGLLATVALAVLRARWARRRKQNRQAVE